MKKVRSHRSRRLLPGLAEADSDRLWQVSVGGAAVHNNAFSSLVHRGVALDADPVQRYIVHLRRAGEGQGRSREYLTPPPPAPPLNPGEIGLAF